LTIESLTSSWLSKTCTSEAPGGHTKSEALLSSRGPILASVSPLDPKSSREASSRFRMPARPLHTQCVSRYLSILRCATRSERRDRVQRFTNDSHRQPASRYSRFIAPFFCGGNVHPLSYNMRKFRGRWCNTQSSATIFLSVLKGEIHL